MVSLRHVEDQLRQVGCNYKMWGRSEIRELCNVLMPEENIMQAVNGTYEGGFALLCVTNYRVLLVDRKPMILTIEDLRYDMIAEVDYYNKFIGATVRIFTPVRNLQFGAWNPVRLRKCVNYIQQRVMEIRQHNMAVSQPGSPQGFQTQLSPGQQPYVPLNPYTKTPMLSRRRRFPSFY